MLSNLRRKRIQRLDIDEWQYFNLKSDVWWNGGVIRCGDTSKIIGKQRYSKKKVKQSFDYDRNIAEKLETIRKSDFSVIKNADKSITVLSFNHKYTDVIKCIEK